MKVLHVSENAYGGVATVLSGLLPELQAVGLEVALALDTHRFMAGETYQWAERFAPVELNLRSPSPRTTSALRRLTRAVDVVHLHGARAGLIGRMSALRTRAVVYSPHGGAFHRFDIDPARRIAARLERLMAGKTDAFVVASQYEAELVKSALPESAHPRVQVIRHACPDGTAVDRGSHDIVRLIAAGRLVREKKFDVAIEALARLPAGHRPELQIFGDGPDRARLEALARQYGLSQTVHFMGYRRLEPVDFQNADILLCLSESESFGLTVVEGLVNGCSVVSTRVGVAAELLEEPAGFLVDATPDAVASAVERAVALRARGDLASEARRVTSALGSWADVGRAYTDLYESLLVQGTSKFRKGG